MPPLKQPTPLRDVAMKVLVDYFTNICLNGEDNPEKFIRGMSSMRNEIVAQMPQQLASEFYNELLRRLFFSSYVSDADLMGISVKIILDQKIMGLNGTYVDLKSLRPEDAHRVREIDSLRMRGGLGHSLENFHLEHLRFFEYIKFCTDSDLKVIADNCPKLRKVYVPSSDGVTDVGLAALSSCSQLRFLLLPSCENITASGVRNFLSVHNLIRYIEAWDWDDWRERPMPGFDFRQVPNWEADLSVHESLEHFTIAEDFSDRHLTYVVTKFPNLRSIDIWEGCAVDLAIIKSLGKLRNIYFKGRPGASLAKLEELLQLIGPQILELEVWHDGDFSTMRRSLDLISRLCNNLEVLHFECEEMYSEASLVLPDFKKIKTIRFHSGPAAKVELGKMPKLEVLEIWDFHVDANQVASIILDQEHFPNLKVIGMDRLLDRADINRIRKIIRTNNLDLNIMGMELWGT